jgi:hypothetical protein
LLNSDRAAEVIDADHYCSFLAIAMLLQLKVATAPAA